jgi:hypothetical protein
LKLAEADAGNFRYPARCDGWLQCSKYRNKIFGKCLKHHSAGALGVNYCMLANRALP